MFREFLPNLFREGREPAHKEERPEDMMSAFFRGFPFDPLTRPAVDVSENENEIIVSAEIPGIDPKEVELTLENKNLIIKGEKKFEHEEKKDSFVRRERGYGSFHRVVPLPGAVKQDAVKADYKMGILTVRLPKDEAAKPKRINVTE